MTAEMILWPKGWKPEVVEVAGQLGLAERLDEVQLIANGYNAVDLEMVPGVFASGMSEGDIKLPDGMWPGPLGSIVGIECKGASLVLRVKLTDYGTFHTAKRLGLLKSKLGPEDVGSSLIPLSFGAITLTEETEDDPDGCIVFGIRGASIDLGGQSTTVPSGYFNPVTDQMIVGDLREAQYRHSVMLMVFRELVEEVGVDYFLWAEHLGLIQDCVGNFQPLLAMRLGLPFSAEELKDRMKSQGDELASLHLVPNTVGGVRNFIEKNPPTPHDVAKLILHFASS